MPALAVTRLGGQAFVYVATQASGGLVARQRPVTLGELTSNAYVIERGVTAGEQIVVSQIQKLRDGAPITQAPAGGGSGAPPHQPPQGR